MARKITHEQYVRNLQDREINIIPIEEYKTPNIKILHKCECNNKWSVKPESVYYQESKCGSEAYLTEQKILREYKEYRYIGEKIMKHGYTELFTENILDNKRYNKK